MTEKTIVATDQAPRAIGPYSQAVRSGEFVFLSGQIPLDPATGQLVSGSIQEEARRVMDNLGAVLEAANATFASVVRCTIYLVDLAHFADVNDVYGSYFPSDPPSRACVQVAALPKGARVEVDAIARVG